MIHEGEIQICGRCGKPIPAEESEACWFCMHALCVTCWDKYGECGHKRAEEMNEEARKKYDVRPEEPGA